jgi:hypothetical protein
MSLDFAFLMGGGTLAMLKAKKPDNTPSESFEAVRKIMHFLRVKNNQYLDLYTQNIRKETGGIGFFSKRITADTRAKKIQAEARKLKLEGLIQQWENSDKPEERKKILEDLNAIIVRDLEQDKRAHGLFKGQALVQSMLLNAQKDLHTLKKTTPKPHRRT